MRLGELAGTIARACARVLRPDDLNAYEARHSSQNGEDGILRELFRRLGVDEGFFVEFGVGDGSECNGAALLSRGWRGLMIEGDPRAFAALRARYANAPLDCVEAWVTAENLAAILQEHGVPIEPDLLSIDVDGNDYWLWQSLAAFRPRIVAIEYNASRPPPERWVMAYAPDHRWRGDGYYGASLAALETLGTRLGYALLGTDRHGVNAFFVRDDLLACVRFSRRTARRAYHRNAYGQAATDGPSVVG